MLAVEESADRSSPTFAHLGAADIALSEIIEGKMGWEMPEIIGLTRPTGKGRKRPQHWAKLRAAA